MLRYLGSRQKSAIARLCTLADLNQHTGWIRHHVRNGLDDTVPAKVAGSNLQDEILEIIRLHQLYRHAALTGAHANRQAALLVQVGTGQCHSLPGTGGQGADGHIRENQRVNPVYRRCLFSHDHLAVFQLERQLLGRQYPAKRRTDIKGMTGGIQRRVRHLGNTANDDAVQSPLGVQVGTAAALDRACILGKQCLAAVRIPDRADGVIRAYLFAHAAATAEISQACHLLDNRTGNVAMLRHRLAVGGNHDGLGLGFYLDSLKRAGSNAAAAHRTSICMIFYFPGKIVYGNVLSLYCFHLCTSSSLSITITSRSFG